MTTISKNLRKLREKANLQQEDMAIKLGVTQSTYHTWESGRSDVKSEYLPKIASILNVEMKELFKTEGSKIEINQTNSDNKDNSINGLVFVLSDKDSIEKLVTILKERI